MPDSCLPFGRTLTSGTYEITESFGFVAPATESALKIADGATVTLDIAAGVEVMLKGGDAVGMTGAGAGIEVPEGATLRIGGVGYLIGLGSVPILALTVEIALGMKWYEMCLYARRDVALMQRK